MQFHVLYTSAHDAVHHQAILAEQDTGLNLSDVWKYSRGKAQLQSSSPHRPYSLPARSHLSAMILLPACFQCTGFRSS